MDELNKEIQDQLLYNDRCSLEQRKENIEILRTHERETGYELFKQLANIIELSGDGPIVMHFTMFPKNRKAAE